jgi:hypothetical protein
MSPIRATFAALTHKTESSNNAHCFEGSFSFDEHLKNISELGLGSWASSAESTISKNILNPQAARAQKDPND